MRTALHTVSYGGVWPGQERLSLEDTILRAGELGFDGVMIMAKRPHLSVLDAEADRLSAVKESLNRAGVQLASLAAYTNFSADASHPGIPINEMQIEYITRLGQIAHELCGGCAIRLFTAYSHEALSDTNLRLRCVSALKECSRRVADYGCTIAVQNHHDCCVHYLSLRELIASVDEPNCGASFDAWSPTLHGDDIAQAAAEMADVVVYTTCADYVFRPRFEYEAELVNYRPRQPRVQMVPMGEGMIDYPGFFDALTAGGYDGWVAFEICAPLLEGGSLETLDTYARGFLDFVGTWVQ